MAPTICDDTMDGFANQNRILRQRSVINYVGRQENVGVVSRNEINSSIKTCEIQKNRELIRYSTEHRVITKRYRSADAFSSESDDSSDSIPNPMTFHNYAKRRRYSHSEDDTDKYISTSSESNENSVSSTLSFNEDREKKSCRLQIYNLNKNPLAPISLVSSTTGSLYRHSSKTPLRSMNPYYQRDLIEIAMKTIILLQKNRSLHARLHQLKLETRAFVNSVMSNPENAKLRRTLTPINESTKELTTTNFVKKIQ